MQCGVEKGPLARVDVDSADGNAIGGMKPLRALPVYAVGTVKEGPRRHDSFL